MSDLEQNYRVFLNRHPEINGCNELGLVNIRALSRFFMKEEGIGLGKLESVIAMIRRCKIKSISSSVSQKMFSDMKISIKDEIIILDYEKSKYIVENLKNIAGNVNYDRNEILKFVVGSQSVKIILDKSNSKDIKQLLSKNKLIKEYKAISEVSLLFSSKALDEKGIVAFVTSQLLVNGINIREIITCTPELIVYFDEEQSLKAYEIFKRMK